MRILTETAASLRFPLKLRESFAPRALPRGVAECLRALDLPDTAWKGVIAKRLNSQVHRASHRGRDVAIKECFLPTGEPDVASACNEFAALARFADACSPSVVAAPRPLAMSEPFGTYAMSWISGTSATRLMLSAKDDAYPARLGVATGNWLRDFHALHPLPARASDFAAKADGVASIGASHAGRHSLVDRAAAVLLNTARAAAAVELPASWIHGDMKSDNLLVDGDAIAGIDLQLADENTIVYDLAPFVNHLHLLAASPRGFIRRKALARMADAFLGAYSPTSAQWRLPIDWLRGYLLLQAVARAEGGWADRIALHAKRCVLEGVVDSLEAA